MALILPEFTKENKGLYLILTLQPLPERTSNDQQQYWFASLEQEVFISEEILEIALSILESSSEETSRIRSLLHITHCLYEAAGRAGKITNTAVLAVCEPTHSSKTPFYHM